MQRSIDDLSPSDVHELIGTPEGRRLEFKRELYKRNDDGKREFASDISAMANASGGSLFIGIEEENGIAKSIPGVVHDDPDSLVRQVSDSIRSSCEPPIIDARVRWIEIDSGRGVLAIEIARSWNAPHRVTARAIPFFLRDENGKHPMSVAELKRSFLHASETEERVRRFRHERLGLLIANEGPLAVDESSPRLILHIVPQAAFTEGVQVHLDEHRSSIVPLGASGGNRMHSLDGLVSYSGPEENFSSVRAFSTLLRKGGIEAVAKIYASSKDGSPTLALTGVEVDLIPGVKHYLHALRALSVPSPFYIMVSLVGVRGYNASTDRMFDRGISYPYRADKLLLPELEVNETNQDLETSAILRPLFDLMWNAFGQRGSPNYDQTGNYLR